MNKYPGGWVEAKIETTESGQTRLYLEHPHSTAYQSWLGDDLEGARTAALMYLESRIIIDTNYAGASLVLVNDDGAIAYRGMPLETFRGESVTLERATAPHKPGSTGRVYVKFQGESSRGAGEFFPSVVNLKWAPMVSEAEA